MALAEQAMTDTAVMIASGFALAILSVAWLWRDQARPAIVEKLYHRIDTMQQEIDELRAAMTSDRENMTELKLEMAEWRRGMALNFAQMRQAGLTPIWTPIEREPQPTTRRPESTLANRIADRFDIDEIDNLAYDVGILKDEFSGTTKEVRARELVELAFRRGISAALLGRVNELRKDKQ